MGYPSGRAVLAGHFLPSRFIPKLKLEWAPLALSTVLKVSR